MTYFLGALISLAQGYCLLRLLLGPGRPKLAWMILTGFLFGLALSAQLTFTSFLFFNRLIAPYIISLNILALIALAFCALRTSSPKDPLLPWKEITLQDGAALAILGLLIIPVFLHAQLFPYGGWDAWSCWNLKARMLFMGGDSWRNMFDPVLWRSNTAYPLMLPLINTWLWSFGSSPEPNVPLFISCLITFLSAGILFFSLKELTNRFLAILAPAWLLSIFFNIQLASSQYSDLLVGTFFLLGIVSFFLYLQRPDSGFLKIALIALGFLSFTKSEGLVLSIITLSGLSLALLIHKEHRKRLTPFAWSLMMTTILAFMVSGIFQIFFAPNSHTLINGLTSSQKPTSLERLAAVFVFFSKEIITPKWNGLWLLAAGGLLLSWRRSLTAGRWIIPVILMTYLAVIFGVYWINTFFEIVWWLSMTMNRILFAIIPTILFWIFLAIL
ncbi:MAG: hypothetical protein HQL21_00675 [Candidatus Omnitrophica bacterium]|nr:hypothetical protein [Candidatus Omnitrophota bacterium]